MGSLFGVQPLGANAIFSFPSLILAIVLIWSIVWKGFALWKSAREGSKVWFVVLLVVNTVGILEILYIYVFSRKRGMGEHGSSKTEAH